MAKSGEETREIGERTLELSNLDKVFFPDAGLTKGDLVDYYEKVAELMLPHLRGRIVSMHRWPDGIEGKDFYQKKVPDHFPSWIRTVEVEKEDGTLDQVVIEDAATLVYLAQQGCVTPHVWLSRANDRDHPDRMVFDLDPQEAWDEAFPDVRSAARSLRELLDEVGLRPRVMTSGSKGLHVHVTLDGSADYDHVREFARDAARLLVRRHPDALTLEQRKEKRGDRIFVDVLRNAYAQTAVAPYSVRARDGAPVAMPLEWEELSSSGMNPRKYTIQNAFRRLSRKDDPWAEMEEDPAGLDEPRKTLDQLLDDEE